MPIYSEEKDPNEIVKSSEQQHRENIIDEINYIIRKHESFDIADVTADHSPCVNSEGKLVHLMECFYEGVGTVYVYDPTSYSSEEIDKYDEFYEELETSELEYILELANYWAEINEED